MFKTASPLSEKERIALCDSLNLSLADATDLYSQLKVAHWNVKGSHFATLHPLFEGFATTMSQHSDELAERAVTLGGRAHGTVRHVATVTRLENLPLNTSREKDFLAFLANHINQFLTGLRQTRGVAEANHDPDTADLVTEMISTWEKNAWFLFASMETA